MEQTANAGKVLEAMGENVREQHILTHYGKLKNKLAGTGFLILLGVSILKEALDVLADLTVFLALLTILLNIVFSIVVWFYLFLHDVKFGTKKIAAGAITVMIEIIPILNVIPTFPLTLLMMRKMEYDELKEATKGAEKAKREFIEGATRTLSRGKTLAA